MSKKDEIITRPRITQIEKELLKGLFSDSEEVYITIRNLFYGFELNELEQKLIKDHFQKPDALKIMRKVFFWELYKDCPLMQNQDMYTTSLDLQKATAETFEDAYEANEIFISFLNKSLDKLGNLNLESVNLTPKKSYPFMVARNGYLRFVDSQLKVILSIATSEDETPEERTKRLQKDSMK